MPVHELQHIVDTVATCLKVSFSCTFVPFDVHFRSRVCTSRTQLTVESSGMSMSLYWDLHVCENRQK